MLDVPPYASVVIPTHDRDHTLDLAVASVRAQSVEAIEIILALDGATDAVRQVAHALAAADSRVRVLDMEKAPANGSANRARAVHAARSERIFYIDDDDLWLPDHVATLGGLLDHAEVAWSAGASASLSGDLHIGFADFALDGMKALVASDTLKILFDTHLAHRRSTYLAAGDPWADESRRTVGNLMMALAAPGFSWRGTTTPTGLSLHGAGRRHLSRAARRQELADWANRLTVQTRGRWMAQARVEWFLHRALDGLKTFSLADPEEFYRVTGMARWMSDAAEWPLTPYQREAADTLFRLVQGRVAPSAVLCDSLPHLMDPLLGGGAQRALIARRLEAALGRQGALDVVASGAPSNPYHAELMALLHSYLLRRARRFGEAQTALAAVAESALHFPAEIHIEAAETACALGQVAAWLGHARRAAEIRPGSVPALLSLTSALIAAGDRTGAAMALSDLLALSPSPEIASRIRHAFADMP